MDSRLVATFARASSLLSAAASLDWPASLAAASSDEPPTLTPHPPAGSLHTIPPVRAATDDEIRVYRASLLQTANFTRSAGMAAIRSLPHPETFEAALAHLATALSLPGVPALGSAEANYGGGAALPSPAEVEEALVAAANDPDSFPANENDDDDTDDDDEEDELQISASGSGKRAMRPLLRVSKRARRVWAEKALDMISSKRGLARAVGELEGETELLKGFAAQGGALLAGKKAPKAAQESGQEQEQEQQEEEEGMGSLEERALAYFSVVHQLNHPGLQRMQLTVQNQYPDLHPTLVALTEARDSQAAATAAAEATAAAAAGEAEAMQGVIAGAGRLRSDWERARAEHTALAAEAKRLEMECDALRVAVGAEKKALEAVQNPAAAAEAAAAEAAAVAASEAAAVEVEELEEEEQKLQARLMSLQEQVTAARVAAAAAAGVAGANQAPSVVEDASALDVSVGVCDVSAAPATPTAAAVPGAVPAAAPAPAAGVEGDDADESVCVVRKINVDALFDDDDDSAANTSVTANNTSTLDGGADDSVLADTSLNTSVNPLALAVDTADLAAATQRAGVGLARVAAATAATSQGVGALRRALAAAVATAAAAASAGAGAGASEGAMAALVVATVASLTSSGNPNPDASSANSGATHAAVVAAVIAALAAASPSPSAAVTEAAEDAVTVAEARGLVEVDENGMLRVAK